MAPNPLGKQQRMPSFFKVMVGNFNKRVRIPRGFIKHIKGEKLPRKPILRGANHKSWRVEMKKSSTDFFFRTGWSGFVKDNSLQLGEFVVFHCDDKLNFDVIILGHDGCEKVFTECEKLQPEVKKESGTEQPSCLCSFIPVKAYGGRVAFDARSCPYKLSNPHFVSVMKPVTMSRITVLKQFGKEVGLCPCSRKRVCIRDPSGRSWPVNFVLHDRRSNRGAFGSGWGEVVKTNELQAGDVCIFEFISKGNSQKPSLFSLHIRRERRQG